MNREEWLEQAANRLHLFLDEIDIDMPSRFRLSCGWPCKHALAKKRRIGECHAKESSLDKVNEIFISPWLDDPIEVLTTALHELIHAADNCQSGHKGFFRRTWKALGFTGKTTECLAGPELTERLNGVLAEIGPYPQHKLDPATFGKEKKDGTRMLKVECPECGYTVRTTAKWIEVGLPVCPCGTTMQSA